MRRRLTGRLDRASLRTRIMVVTTLAAGLALVVALAAYAFTLDRILYSTAIAAAEDQAQQVAVQVGGRDHDADNSLAQIPARGSILQLVDAQGHVVEWSDASAREAPVTDMRPAAGQTQSAPLTMGGHEPYAVVATGLAHPTPDGATVLLVASPLHTETTLVHGATIALAVLALAVLGGLLWLINRVLSSALGRVEDIRSTVGSIRDAGQHDRVPVPSGGDEIARLAVTMNDMLDRLERADSSQRAFVSDASHELRSPLTTIRMLSETSPEGMDRDTTAVVAGEAVRMQHLVDDMLTLARADDRGLRLHLVDVDLDELVAQQVRRARARGDLTVRAGIEATRVVGDPDRLDQVLSNLVDNAMRHARTAVRLECRLDGDHAVVHVDNDGDPVPPAQREAVFDRFVRLQEARDRDSGGSGLGLAIVRAMVTAHEGQVAATEATDGWCRFAVSLPVEPGGRVIRPGQRPPG